MNFYHNHKGKSKERIFLPGVAGKTQKAINGPVDYHRCSRKLITCDNCLPGEALHLDSPTNVSFKNN